MPDSSTSFREALAQDPLCLPAIVGLGEILRSQGDLEGALSFFRQAEEIDPDSYHFRMDVAGLLLRLRRTDEAEAQFVRACEEQPDRAPAWYGRGEIQRGRGAFEEALSSFAAAAERDPTNPAYRGAVAEEWLRQNQPERAAEAYRQILAIDPNFAPAYAGLGAALRLLNDHEGALTAYRRAATIAANDSDLRATVAEGLAKLGRTDEAFAALRALLASDPRSLPALARLGDLRRNLGDFEGALEAFRRAEAIDPASLVFCMDVADLLLRLQRDDEADAQFERALVQQNDFALAWNGKGEVRRRRGDFEAALAAFRRALELEPDNAWFACAVASELLRLGRVQEAVDAFRQVAAAHPAFEPALTGLGQACAQLGDVDGALAAFRDLLARDAHSLSGWAGLGGALRESGDFEGALAAFREAERLNPSSLVFRMDVAGLLLQLERNDEADAHFDRALADRPDFAPAWNGKGEVQRRHGDFEAALQAFQNAARHDRQNPWYATAAAGEMLRLGRVQEAVAAYRAIVTDRPHFAPALAGLGESLRQAGDRDAAMEFYAPALAADPENLDLRLGFAAALRETGRWPEAEASLRETARLHPASAPARIELSRCLKLSGSVEDALAALREATALAPADYATRLALARECLEARRLDEAQDHFAHALQLRPDGGEAKIGLALVARGRGRRAEATERLKAAAARDPSPAALGELAQEMFDAGDRDGAAAMLRSALAARPGSRELAMRLGYVERRRGRREAARDAFLAAARQPPEFVQGYVDASVEEVGAGRIEEGLALLRHALTLRPDEPSALDWLARLLQMDSRLDEAKRVFELSQRAAPHRSEIAIADIESKQGRIDLALDRLKELARMRGMRPEIASAKAIALHEHGRLREAADALDEAIAEFPAERELRRQRLAVALSQGDAAAARAGIEAEAASEGADLIWLRAQLAALEWDFATAAELATQAAEIEPADPTPPYFAAQARVLNLETEGVLALLRTYATRAQGSIALRGDSANPLQTHVGELFTELRLDSVARSEVWAARSGGEAERLVSLSQAVLRYPDYTPAAFELLIEARRQGRFPSLDAARRGELSEIPRQIVQFWDSEAMPADVERIAQTWIDCNPEHAYRRFSGAAAERFLHAHFGANVVRTFRRARAPAQKADLFRLAFLYVEGGFYADADDRCVGALDALDPGGRSLVFYQESFGSLGNDFLGATPRHPVLLDAFERAVAAVDRDEKEMIWLSTGPGLLTRAVASAVASALPAGPDIAPSLLVLSRAELSRSVGVGCLASYKNGPRHWTRIAFKGAHARFSSLIDEILAVAVS